MAAIVDRHVERLQLVATRRLHRRRPISVLWFAVAVFLIFVALFDMASS